MESNEKKPLHFDAVIDFFCIENSYKVVAEFCQHVRIPFKEEYLSWQKLDGNFSFECEWGCTHPDDISRWWYDKAIASTGFTSKNLPKYIENLEHRVFWKQLYEEKLPYYKLFLEEYCTH